MTGLDWMNTPPLPSIRTTTITSPHPASSTRAHPGHEAPWDSPIEDATHPLHNHHSHHSTHHHHHNSSGASTPSSSPADPGFESPWDSPIMAPETPTTPVSEFSDSDFEFLKHEAPAACFAPHPMQTQRRGEEKEEGGKAHHQSKPVKMARVEHPPLGSSNGHFAKQQLARGQLPLGELRDSSSREEFLWCMIGMGGCGR